MKYLKNKFCCSKILIGSTFLFYGIFTFLIQCEASNSLLELEENSFPPQQTNKKTLDFSKEGQDEDVKKRDELSLNLEENIFLNVEKVLADSYDKEEAPKAFTNHIFTEEKKMIMNEADKIWTNVLKVIDNSEDERLKKNIEFIETYLFCLALANNQFLENQKIELEKEQNLKSDKLSVNFQKLETPNLESINIINENKKLQERLDFTTEENKKLQTHKTDIQKNIEMRKFTFWERFYILFGLPLASILKLETL